MRGECFGTFALVFAGTGAIVANDLSGGAISHVGIALTFGLIVLVMIYTIGDISGCHINPAVTLGFCISRRFEAKRVIPYVVSQVCGALLASLAIRLNVSFPSIARCYASVWRCPPSVHHGVSANPFVDGSDPKRLKRISRKRNHGGSSHRGGDRAGSHVWRTNQRCFDEPGTVAGTAIVSLHFESLGCTCWHPP